MKLVTRALVVADRTRRVWWWVRRPITVGAQMIVVDADERVLFVRNSYDSAAWLRFPGGGVKRRETLVAAAIRELREETGITVNSESAPTLLGIYGSFKEAKSDHVAVFVVRNPHWSGGRAGDSGFDNAEIEGRAWAPLADPPEHITPATARRLAEVRGEKPISWEW